MTIAVVTVVVVTFFSKNNLTPPKPMRFLRAAFRDLAMFFPKFRWLFGQLVLNCALGNWSCEGVIGLFGEDGSSGVREVGEDSQSHATMGLHLMRASMGHDAP